MTSLYHAKPKIYNFKCAYQHCDSTTRDKKLTFFAFPKDKIQRTKWTTECWGLQKLTTKTRLCSKHFEDDCFLDPVRIGPQKRRLRKVIRKDALPTLFWRPPPPNSKLPEPQPEFIPIEKPQKPTITLQTIKEKAGDFVDPVKGWLYKSHGTSVSFYQLNDTTPLQVTKSLTIDEELEVRGYLAQEEQRLNIIKATTLADVALALEELVKISLETDVLQDVEIKNEKVDEEENNVSIELNFE